MKKKITKLLGILCLLLFALTANSNLRADNTERRSGRWNESLLPPYSQHSQQVAWKQEGNTGFLKAKNTWWNTTRTITGIALSIILTGYLLFILRRKRRQRMAEEQSAQSEEFAKDALWVCSNNPRLRITADQLCEALGRIKETSNHKQRIDDYTIN